MKLLELSGTIPQTMDYNPALRQVVINEIRAVAPLFDVAEFYTITGNSDAPRLAATAVGGATRALDSDYTGVTASPAFGSVTLKIYGDVIRTDIAHERRGGDIASERVRQLVSFARGLGRHLTDHTINGDSTTPTEFDGLKSLITDAQLRSFMDADNGAQVLLGSDNTAKKSQQEFLREIDDLIYNVGAPSCLIMAPKTISYLKAIGREYVQTTTAVQALTGSFEVYNGVPIINAGYKKDGTTLVIGHNETKGTSTDCTSVYCVKFGEKEDVTFATNVGIQVRDRGLVGVQYQTLVELDIALVLINAKSAMRLEGIRLA